MTQRAQARTVAVVCALAAGLAAWAATRLGLGPLRDPGPGLWPLIAAVVMLAAAISLVVWPDVEVQEPFTRDTLLVFAALASLIVYAFVFERAGFELPTVALLVLWLRVLARESWRITIAVSIGAVVAVALVFVVALNVNLPHLSVY